MMNRKTSPHTGFTLVELLVSIVIVVALAALAIVVSQRGILKGQQAKTLQQLRDMGLGIEAFSIDYNRPPIPQARLDEGIDTVYGNPGGSYGSEVIIGTLIGEDADYSTGTDETISTRQMNPRGENYITPIIVDDNRAGVGRDDGKFYDSWGNEIMIGINTPPFEVTENTGSPGVRDKILQTFGLAEWSDKKPRYQNYVLWSYGKDGTKAETYAGSDDVANF